MSELFSSLPDNPSLRDVLLMFPKASSELMAFIEQVMRAESPLSVGHRELLATFVSSLNSCQFCYGAHLAFSRAFGIEKDKLPRYSRILKALLSKKNLNLFFDMLKS